MSEACIYKWKFVSMEVIAAFFWFLSCNVKAAVIEPTVDFPLDFGPVPCTGPSSPTPTILLPPGSGRYFQSPFYPRNYLPHTSCSWYFSSSPGCRLSFFCGDFSVVSSSKPGLGFMDISSLARSGNATHVDFPEEYINDILAINSLEDSFCVGDYLRFQSYTREGRSFSVKFCNNTEAPILEMEGTVQVVFQSDGSFQDTGFDCEVTCLPYSSEPPSPTPQKDTTQSGNEEFTLETQSSPTTTPQFTTSSDANSHMTTEIIDSTLTATALPEVTQTISPLVTQTTYPPITKIITSAVTETTFSTSNETTYPAASMTEVNTDSMIETTTDSMTEVTMDSMTEVTTDPMTETTLATTTTTAKNDPPVPSPSICNTSKGERCIPFKYRNMNYRGCINRIKPGKYSSSNTHLNRKTLDEFYEDEEFKESTEIPTIQVRSRKSNKKKASNKKKGSAKRKAKKRRVRKLFWCATKVDASGSVKKWGECSSKCKTDPLGSYIPRRGSHRITRAPAGKTVGQLLKIIKGRSRLRG